MITAKSAYLLVLVVLCASLVNYYLKTNNNANLHEKGKNEAHTPEEWLELFTCNETERRLASIKRPYMDVCQRCPTAWRYKYLDEQVRGDVLVQEPSIDQRLANMIYTTHTTRWTDPDHFMFNSGDQQMDELNKRIVAGPQVSDEKCRRHLSQMVALMADLDRKLRQQRKKQHQSDGYEMHLNESHIRLARVLDSFGRYDAGYLGSGKTQSLGSYEQCQRAQLKFIGSTNDDHEKVPTRFCWARLRADKHLNEALKLRKKYKFDSVGDNSLLAGVCLPDSCHSITFDHNKHLLQTLVDSQFRLPKSIYIDETLELESIFCLPDKESEFSIPWPGKLLLIAISAWLALVAYATISRRQTSSAPKWTSWLDLLETWGELVGWKDVVEPKPLENKTKTKTTPAVDLDALNIVKVMSCLLVVISHSFIISQSYAEDSLVSKYTFNIDTVALLAASAIWLVDTLFVLSGLIVAYSSFNFLRKALDQGERSTSLGKCCLSISVRRYLRLVPMFILTHWFKKFVFIYLGSGPLWDFGFNKESPWGACRQEESWLTPFTFSMAYVPVTKACLIQGWSISTDIFFSYILGPLALFMYLRPKLATWTILSVCAASIGAYCWTAANRITGDVRYELQDMFKLYGFRTVTIGSHLYSQLEYRCGSLFVGFLGGYCLYRIGLNSDNSTQKAAKVQPQFGFARGPLTILAVCYAVLIYLLRFLLSPMEALIQPYQGAIFYALPLVRTLFAVANAFLFIRMATDWRQSTVVRTLSSSRLLKVLNKLNYGIMLVHLELILMFYYYSNSRTSIHSSGFALACGGYVYLLSVLISIFLYLMLESPINKSIQFVASNVLRKI